MKIYTEINYKWLAGGLVETDSKSFEYEGDLTLCGPGGGGGNPITAVIEKVQEKIVDPVVETATLPEIKVPELGSITPKIDLGTINVPKVDVGLGDLADLPSQIDQAMTDPTGSITTGLGKLGENAGALGTTVGEASGDLTKLGGLTEAVAKGTQLGMENIQSTDLGKVLSGEVLQPTSLEGIGMNEGVATTLADVGSKIDEGVTSFGDKLIDDDLERAFNTNVDYLHDYGKALNDVVSDELTRWQDWINQKTGEISANVPGMNNDGPDAVPDPDKLKAVKRGLKNKSRANLKVNKSKGRARSSLRVG
jgi:hypothetical protein